MGAKQVCVIRREGAVPVIADWWSMRQPTGLSVRNISLTAMIRSKPVGGMPGGEPGCCPRRRWRQKAGATARSRA